MADFAKKQIVRKKKEIFRQGDEPEAVYFITRGIVKLSYGDSEGREVTVNLRHSGELIGVATAIVQTEYDLSAVALTDCSLLRIPVSNFIEATRNDAHLSWRVNQMNCRNLMSLNARLTRIARLSARQHLEHLLWHFLLEQYRGYVVNLPSANILITLPISDRDR